MTGLPSRELYFLFCEEMAKVGHFKGLDALLCTLTGGITE